MDSSFVKFPLGIPQNQAEIDKRINLARSSQAYSSIPVEKIKYATPKGELFDELDLLFLNLYYFQKKYDVVDLEFLTYLKTLKFQPIVFDHLQSNDIKQYSNKKFASYYLFVKEVRAKLAVKELSYYYSNDDSILIELLSISLHYLSCPIIINRINQAQVESRTSKNVKEKEKAKKLIGGVQRVIKGNTKAKEPMIGYWYAHFMYEELKVYINKFNTINGPEAFLIYQENKFQISKERLDLIKGNADTPESIALTILQEKKLIKNPEQFKKGYAKNISKIKKSIGVWELIPPLAYLVFDAIALNPLLLTKIDPFGEMNQENF